MRCCALLNCAVNYVRLTWTIAGRQADRQVGRQGNRCTGLAAKQCHHPLIWSSSCLRDRPANQVQSCPPPVATAWTELVLFRWQCCTNSFSCEINSGIAFSGKQSWQISVYIGRGKVVFVLKTHPLICLSSLLILYRRRWTHTHTVCELDSVCAHSNSDYLSERQL